jgi:hypothetical protein
VTEARSRRGDPDGAEPSQSVEQPPSRHVEFEDAAPSAGRRGARADTARAVAERPVSSRRFGGGRGEAAAPLGSERPGAFGRHGEPAEAPGGPARGRRSARAAGTDETAAPTGSATGAESPDASALPRRVRQASLAPQLKDGPERRTERDRTASDGPGPAERDADDVRSRMASLQRGWQRGREENAGGDDAHGGSARGTTEGDGR